MYLLRIAWLPVGGNAGESIRHQRHLATFVLSIIVFTAEGETIGKFNRIVGATDLSAPARHPIERVASNAAFQLID